MGFIDLRRKLETPKPEPQKTTIINIDTSERITFLCCRFNYRPPRVNIEFSDTGNYVTVSCPVEEFQKVTELYSKGLGVVIWMKIYFLFFF